MHYKVIILILLLSGAAHAQTDSSNTTLYSAYFTSVIKYGTCQLLVDSVEKSIRPRENGSYFKSSFTPTTQGSVAVSFPCMTTLKKKDARLLFGTPNRPGPESDIYFTSKPYKNCLPNSF